MAAGQVFQVSRLLDERGISAFHVKLIIWLLFIVLIDGYAIGAIAFAAPSLIKEWHFPPSALGPLLGALFVALPVEQLYMWAAIPFAIGAVLCFVIYRLNEARLKERPWMREAHVVPAE